MLLGDRGYHNLSVNEPMSYVTCRCVQSMHALRIMRNRGLPNESL